MDNPILMSLKESMIDECVDLFMDTFSKEPWNDTYESRDQVVNFFRNHIANNYFVGYVAMVNSNIVALSVGMKKPWINGMEYYVDEFCVSHSMQGKGIGSWFIQAIESDILVNGMNAMILNTEQGYPSHTFYEKNGFSAIEGLIVLAK
jgi:GNAT superfamily N-acetyltransferase